MPAQAGRELDAAASRRIQLEFSAAKPKGKVPSTEPCGSGSSCLRVGGFIHSHALLP